MCFINKLVIGLGGEEKEQGKTKKKNRSDGLIEDKSEKKENCHVR